MVAPETRANNMRLGKSSGSIGLGAFFIVISLILTGLLIYVFSLIIELYTKYDENYFTMANGMTGFMAVVVSLMTPFVFVMGVLNIKKGLTDKKVKAHGKKSVCTIKEFKVTHSRYSATIWMDVKFKTQSGKEDVYSARVHQDAINRFQQGMRVECYVLGENCYVDPDNLRVVEKEDF